ncbi:MAG TPA: AIM24 family protein [Gemmatimonadales bacterium]|nr:AIM24 family protein [Gemmatimonadales bacterium]
MVVPVQLPTAQRDVQVGGVTYHVEGELVPVLHLELQRMPVYFEHHILLWKSPGVEVDIKPLKGAFKRVMAGMPVFLTQTKGVGHIAFSRDGAGHVFGIHLKEGQAIDVREHQFLAATDNVEYSFARVKGVANMLFGGTGFFIDTFACKSGSEGVVWLHGYGNVFEVTLKPGDMIDVEPGGWVYKDPTVRMETMTQKLSTGLFGSAGMLFWNRFHGPGRLAIQSMYLHLPTEA